MLCLPSIDFQFSAQLKIMIKLNKKGSACGPILRHNGVQLNILGRAPVRAEASTSLDNLIRGALKAIDVP